MVSVEGLIEESLIIRLLMRSKSFRRSCFTSHISFQLVHRLAYMSMWQRHEDISSEELRALNYKQDIILTP